MQFFQPNKKFLDWVVKLAGPRPIIDCGCGEGQVTRALLERGANVLGIDILASGEDTDVAVPCDATTFQFPQRAIVLFCRPCHSDWVERAIDRAKQRADVILYVGLDRNLEYDLGKYKYKGRFKKIAKRAGKDDESVWAMDRIGADVVRWCLIKPDFWDAPSWVEDGGDRWINLAGGYFHKSDGVEILESLLTDEYRQLDWKKTGIYKTSGTAGWLDPGGKMHYCDTNEHRLYADLILNATEDELMERGWCRVRGKNTDFDFYCAETLTAEQWNFLQVNGYRGLEDLDTGEPKTAMLSIGDGKEYPTEPGLLRRDKTSE